MECLSSSNCLEKAMRLPFIFICISMDMPSSSLKEFIISGSPRCQISWFLVVLCPYSPLLKPFITHSGTCFTRFSSWHEYTASKQKLTYREGLYWLCAAFISHIQAAFNISHFAHVGAEKQTNTIKWVIFETENFIQEAKSEFQRILILKSAYF